MERTKEFHHVMIYAEKSCSAYFPDVRQYFNEIDMPYWDAIHHVFYRLWSM